MDLRKLAQDAEGAIEPPVQLTPREQVWSIRYESPEGQRHEGSVTSRIMTGDERFKASRITSDLLGRPWTQVPPQAQIHAIALGVIAVQLRHVPEWLLTSVQSDEELALELLATCRGHDTRWFRRDIEKGEGLPQERRIFIDPIGIPPAPPVESESPYAGSRSGGST